jgi:hypothetical protein
VFWIRCLVYKAIIHLVVKETFIPCRRYFRFSSVCSYKYLPHIVTTKSIETGSNNVLDKKRTRRYREMGSTRSCKTRRRWKAVVSGILNSWSVNIHKCKQEARSYSIKPSRLSSFHFSSSYRTSEGNWGMGGGWW